MDHMKVWNILTLQPPTDAPDELLDMYKDQVSLLNIIVEEDKESVRESEGPVMLSHNLVRQP